MKKSFFFCSLLISIFNFAQEATDLPTVVPPSPTVANLMSFEEVPVDYYTGQPDIGIPLFSKQLGNGLGINIALKYHTAGVKIDSRSSWVGTGWSLFAGGSISRTVKGVPDEFQKGPDSSTKTGVLHNPDFWNYDSLSNYNKGGFTWSVNGSSQDLYDSQLDLYQFNFLGVSGRFIIIKDGNALKPILLTKNQNVKIIVNYDPVSYKIDSFDVSDTSGNKFVFNVIEYTESEPVTGSATQGNGVLNIYASGAAGVYTNRSAWHLSSIQTSNNTTLASLSYSDSNESYTASVTRTENRITSINGVLNDILSNTYNLGVLRPRQSVSYLTTTSQTKKLLGISFKDGSSISLSTSTAHPETAGAILKEVIIKNAQGIENKRFSLTHESTDRLWLTKVIEKAGGQNLNYDLTYFNKNELPAFDTGSDAWGYNDGFGNTSTSCAQQINFDLTAIQKGLLTSITYPTGGKKVFTFEHNTFSREGNSLLPTPDYFTYNHNNIESNSVVDVYNIDNNSGTIVLQPFTLDFDQKILVNNLLSTSNPEGLFRCKIVLNRADGSEYYREDLDKTGCSILDVPAGDYLFGVQVIDPLTIDPYFVSGTASLSYKSQKTIYRQEALGGGIRIKEIAFIDLDEPLSPKKKITYTYTDEANTNMSSGSVDAKIGSLLRKYSLQTKNKLFMFQDNWFDQFIVNTVFYDVTSSGNTAQLTKGGYVGYKNVVVSETGNGQTVFNYTTPQDYPSPPGTFEYPFPPAPNIDYKRGLLLKQSIYDQSGKILSETINSSYNMIETIEAPSFTIFDPEDCEWRQFYVLYEPYMNKSLPTDPSKIPLCASGQSCVETFDNCEQAIPPPNYVGPVSAIKDDIKSGWAQLKETISKQYFYDENSNQSFAQSRQEFDYNNINFQQSTVRSFLKENGVEVENKTEIFYPVSNPTTEYTASQNTTISKMVTLNMINEAIYTNSYRNDSLISTVQKIYEEFHPDLIRLQNITTKKGTAAKQERVVYHDYDTHSNPLQVSKKDGSMISYLWGHDKTLPIAKIENATIAEIAAALGITESVLDTYNESNMAAIDALRGNAALSGAMISTYTYHDPLIGIATMTDPRGYTIYYNYDEFNRLKEVRDADNNLVSDYQYNYKN